MVRCQVNELQDLVGHCAQQRGDGRTEEQRKHEVFAERTEAHIDAAADQSRAHQGADQSVRCRHGKSEPGGEKARERRSDGDRRHEFRRFVSVASGPAPVSNKVLHSPTRRSFVPLRLIGPTEREPMTPIESRRGLVLPEVLEILFATRRQERGEVRRRTVIDVVAPRVGGHKLQIARSDVAAVKAAIDEIY